MTAHVGDGGGVSYNERDECDNFLLNCGDLLRCMT